MGIRKNSGYSTLLWECEVAGIRYQDLSVIEENLSIGGRVTLTREPDNKFDYFAISVWNMKNKKLGYIPRRENIILARLIDADKTLEAFIVEKDWTSKHLNLKIRIFLSE